MARKECENLQLPTPVSRNTLSKTFIVGLKSLEAYYRRTETFPA